MVAPPASEQGSDVNSVLSGLLPDAELDAWTQASPVQGMETQCDMGTSVSAQCSPDGVATQTNVDAWVQCLPNGIGVQTSGQATKHITANVPREIGVNTGYGDLTTIARPFEPLCYSTKQKVYFKGKKQFQEINRLPNEEVEKLPMFIMEPHEAKISKPYKMKTPCHRRKLLSAITSDVDLVYALKMEAAFIPRSISLLTQLKQKARKWLNNWDLSNYTSEAIYKMTMNAIAQAMLVDQEEMKVRAVLNITEERAFVRPEHTTFLTQGRTGLGSSTCLNRPLARVSAWRRFVAGRWTRAIRF